MTALVGIIMGSTSDWETMRFAAETLERLGIPHEVEVVSAHRTPTNCLNTQKLQSPKAWKLLLRVPVVRHICRA